MCREANAARMPRLGALKASAIRAAVSAPQYVVSAATLVVLRARKLRRRENLRFLLGISEERLIFEKLKRISFGIIDDDEFIVTKPFENFFVFY
jgi:hypothetical protein